MISAKIVKLTVLVVKWFLICGGAIFLASAISIVFVLYFRGQDFDFLSVMVSAAKNALRGGGVMALFLGIVIAVNYFKSRGG